MRVEGPRTATILTLLQVSPQPPPPPPGAGKKYLLDLGTADFESSLGWFLQNYGAWGVQFDEIWAWEVETMPAREYWAHVPSETLPHLHFYNIPVTVDATHPDNPINIIRSIYKPGDFVVSSTAM